MNLNSKKFKYLLQAQTLLDKKIVPSFIKITGESDLNKNFPLSILRSSLLGEAEDATLLSGKSLSIPHLFDQVELRNAYQQISQQPNLHEVILQEEISWNKHLTLIFEKDFIFIESKSQDSEVKPHFSYWTPIGHTAEDKELFTSLNRLLKKLEPMTDCSSLWLMELGLKDDSLYLFQIQPISFSFLGNIFSQNLVQEMLLSRQRFQKTHGLMAMIKTEWAAFKFRKNFSKKNEHPPSWIFLNWEFIFHYFRIYCLQKNLKPSQEAFASFLTVGHEKNWMGEILRRHFNMANQLRLHESHSEVNFVFDQNPALIFIGNGKFEGKIGKEVCLLKDLTPSAVYELPPNIIILTKTFSLLSHGILAAIERKIKLVAGIPDEQWDQLREDETICLDFEKRTFEIK